MPFYCTRSSIAEAHHLILGAKYQVSYQVSYNGDYTTENTVYPALLYLVLYKFADSDPL